MKHTLSKEAICRLKRTCMIFALAGVLGVVLFPFLTPCYSGPKTDHFDGTRFYNPWNPSRKTYKDMVKWKWESHPAEWPERVENPPRPSLVPRIEGRALRATWIGHATVLIQTEDLNILTDPMFSERASPFSFIGPKRVRPPFVPIEKLPRIDVIIISHNHYEHMDLPSLKALWKRDKPRIITTLGNDRIIGRAGGGIKTETYDWKETVRISPGVTLTPWPVQHWSKRTLADTNKALWSGYVLNTEGRTLFFSGDTGYGDGQFFRDAARKFGPMDIALIPIGAYEPRWFMAYSHVNPEEAIKSHRDLQARKSMGIHHETFRLTDEAFGSPRKALEDARKAAGIAESDFIAPYPGDFIELP